MISMPAVQVNIVSIISSQSLFGRLVGLKLLSADVPIMILPYGLMDCMCFAKVERLRLPVYGD